MIYDKLDPAFKTKVTTALRSGNYQQGRSMLYNAREDTYCCLGVVGAICGVPLREMNGIPMLDSLMEEGKRISTNYDIPRQFTDRDAANGITPVGALVDLNDNQSKSFNQIADWIDINL